MDRNLGRRIAKLTEPAPLEGAAPSGERADRPGDSRGCPSTAVSFGEERMWFLQRLEPESAAYNLHAAVQIKGEIQPDLLEQALQLTAQRQAALRTSFPESHGRPERRVSPASAIVLRHADLRADGADELGRRLAWQAQTPFDLEQSPLARVELLQTGKAESVLSLTIHHIVSDGWSLRVFFTEVLRAYVLLAAGRSPHRPPLDLEYPDFAASQRAAADSPEWAKDLSYWTAKLKDAPVLDFPADRKRPSVQGFHGGRVEVALSNARLGRLRELSSSEGATLFMTLLSLFKLLLFRHCGQPDLTIGSPVSNRSLLGSEGLIGYFGNTLALRTDLLGLESFRDLIQSVRESVLEAFAHQQMPFERIVQEVSPSRTRTHHPIYQAMFVLNEPWSPAPPGPLTVTPLPSVAEASLCDLTLALVETDRGLSGYLEYSSALFDRETADRIARRFETLVGAALESPESSLGELEMLPAGERRLLTHEWNRTERPYPKSVLHELFESQAARTPHAVAVRASDGRLTYAELSSRSDEAARRLGQCGFGCGDLAGLALPRTAEAIVWMLAVLKAGGAYVPLDISYPAERLAFIVADSAAKLLIASRASKLWPIPSGVKVVFIEDEGKRAEDARQAACVERRPGDEDLAYVLYTSGSTGTPKGVAIEHRSPVSLIRWTLETYSPEELAFVAVSTSFSFDLSVFEIFAPLACGGTAVLVPDLLHLAASPGAEATTLVNTVPSVLQAVLRSGSLPPSVRTINLAGEPLSQALVRKVFDATTARRVVDLYGPTEDTTYSTFAERDRDSPETIGRPIANKRAYIVDAGMRLTPLGIPGELCLAGAGLARGYLGRPELTAERFVDNPFESTPGARLYRTGDRARFRADGQIELLGRLDHQVKIRGFRVELGEIEAVLCEDPTVAAAAVLARSIPDGGQQLAAFVVAADGREPDPAALRQRLARKLPDFMEPATIAVLDGLPTSPNGKLDRMALAGIPASSKRETEPTGPRTETERTLVRIWSDLLEVERVGVHDDFFELGGHSLLAVEVFARISEELGVAPPLAVLFETPNIETLATLIDQRVPPDRLAALTPIQSKGELPPLFCVHADSGLALVYRDLAARLGEDQPLYAFQSIGLDGSEAPLESIEKMAERYIAEMLTLRPRGPYRLAGFCMGAYIAQEMARQLELAGESVDFLGCFNTDGEWRAAQTFREGLLFHRENLARLPASRKVSYVAERAVYRLTRLVFGAAGAIAASWSRSASPLPLGMRHLHIQEINRRANLAFRSRAFSGKVVFFQGHQDAFRDPKAFWERVALGGTEIVPVPGKEVSVLQEPHVAQLAEELRRRLGQADWPAFAPSRQRFR